MKKTSLCLALAAILGSASVVAQDNAGGSNAFLLADGSFNAPVIAAAATATVITVGLVSNANGSAPIRVIEPVDPVDPVDPTCSGDDALVDGVCIGNTVTTTVTGTGTGTNTGTTTITVPVTFTYAPTI